VLLLAVLFCVVGVSSKPPQIPLQWDCQFIFHSHRGPVQGHVYQDRVKSNRTRVDASGGGRQGSSIYDLNTAKSYFFGAGDCYVARLSDTEVLLLNWDWLGNSTLCPAQDGPNCWTYAFRMGEVKMWYSTNSTPQAYEVSEGGERFKFAVTNWTSERQDPSHFQIPSFC